MFSLASWRKRSFALGSARGGIRCLGNGVLIGSPSVAEEKPGGTVVDERDCSEGIFFNASCPSLVRCGKINISWSVGSSDRDAAESASVHVIRRGMVVLVSAFDLILEVTCERKVV